MRIQSLHLDGFGRFIDTEIADLSSGLTVLLGPNEAGKSTLLAFVRAVLFGFPDARSKENPYPPPAGIRHGGHLVLVDRSGVPYTVRRHAGKRGGEVHVTSPGLPSGGEEMLRELLGSAERGLFRNVFAFSLEELQRLENLEDEGVRSVLYSAGLGSAVVDLPQIEKSLTDRAEAWFKPRGSKPRINQTLDLLKKAEENLRALGQQPERYRDLHDELESLAERARDLQDGIERRTRRQQKLKRLQEARESWVRWLEAAERLENLPLGPAFPSEGVSRLESLLERRRDLLTRLEGRRLGRARLQARVQGLRPEEVLLERAEAIRRMGARRSEWDRLRLELPGLQRQEEEIRRQVRDLLAEIDPSWDLETLRACDTSLPARERIRAHGAELLRCEQILAQAGQNLSEARKQVQEAEEHLDSRKRDLEQAVVPDPALEGLSPRELTGARERWRAAREAARRDRENEREASRSAEQTMERLGPGWTRERILQLEPNHTTLEELRNHREHAAGRAAALQQADSAVRALEDQQCDLQTELQAASRGLDSIPTDPGRPEEPQKVQTALTRARESLHTQEICSRRLEELRRRTGGLGILGLMVLVCLVLTFLGWQRGVPELTLAGLLLGGLVLVAGLLLRRNWQKESRQAEQGLQEAQAGLSQAARFLGLSEPVSRADLEGRERDLLLEAGSLERARSARERLDRVQERAQRHADSLQKALQARSAAEGCCQEEARAWTGWLEARGLPEGLLPESTRDLLEEIRRVAEALRRHESLKLAAGRSEAELQTLGLDLLATLERAGRAGSEESLEDRLSELIRDCEGQAERMRQQESLRERAQEAESRLARDRRRLESAQEEFQEATTRRESARQAWSQERSDLPEGSPETALEILERAFTAQEHFKRWEIHRSNREELERTLSRLHAEACELLAGCTRPPPPPEELAGALDRLVQDLETAQEQFRERQECLKQIQDDPEPPEVLEEELERVCSGIRQLLEQAGAEDEEAFRRAAEVAARRRQLEGELEQLKLALHTAGGSQPFEEFRAELEASDPDGLLVEASRLEEELLESREALAQVQQETGRARQELRTLEQSAERARLQQTRASLAESLRSQALEWATSTLATRLLQKARARYEQERQPEVIRRAAGHFAAMTSGRYPRLFAPVGEKKVLVEKADGTRLETTCLSRGTAEQLYLALRLGFVQEFSRRSEPLPLVMDDIFVNFDPERARLALLEVLGLTDEHQVLLFTCHPETVERALRIHPETQVRNLEAN